MTYQSADMRGTVDVRRAGDGALVVRLAGEWKLGKSLPRADAVLETLRGQTGATRVVFDTEALAGWDSGLLTFLVRIIEYCRSAGVGIERQTLPAGVNRLLDLALAVPERKGARRTGAREGFFTRVGIAALKGWEEIKSSLRFTGEVFLAFLKMLVGKARFRRSDFVLVIQESGAQALAIVSLISFLVGLILAFVGAIQLRAFGAQIYVADLVGIAMTRDMGAIMTGIIMAGRTGASFAAQLGTMVVNEEIDSLETLGISPAEFLVLPRVLALVLMMPLLCLYADLMGILGGMVVGVSMLDIGPLEYYHQTAGAVRLGDVWIGVFMGGVFGIIVAHAGCMRGLQCGRSSSAVGSVTTAAVVNGIVSIIIATAVITVICDVLGI